MNTEQPNFAPYGQPWPPRPAAAHPAAPHPAQPPVPVRAGWSVRRRLAAAGAAAALAVGAGSAGAAVALTVAGPGTAASSPVAVSGVSGKGATVAQVAAAVQPSVVSIETRGAEGAGTGSGVVLRADGTILTNAHVVEGAAQVTVKFSDGRTAPARVLGSDTAHDIAVVRATGVSGLKPAVLGDSDKLAVGDPVLALGSPLGLDGSVTSGIVSALGRQIQEGDSGEDRQLPPYLRGQVDQRQRAVIQNAVQTDAAINPGNSGGALVNGAGQLIGVNTAIATSGSGSGSIGVGFAIPVNDAKKAADRIIAKAAA
ncbi:S1C family serine protease [Spirillospora sp. NPDC127200]